MSAIGKQFTKLGEIYTVVEETKRGYVCSCKSDYDLWVFTFEEVRRALEASDD